MRNLRSVVHWRYVALIVVTELLFGYFDHAPATSQYWFTPWIFLSFGVYFLAFISMMFVFYKEVRMRSTMLFVAASLALYGLFWLQIYASWLLDLVVPIQFLWSFVNAMGFLILLDRWLHSGISLRRAALIIATSLGVFYYAAGHVPASWSIHGQIMLLHVVGGILWQLLVIGLMEAAYTYRVKWLVRTAPLEH